MDEFFASRGLPLVLHDVGMLVFSFLDILDFPYRDVNISRTQMEFYLAKPVPLFAQSYWVHFAQRNERVGIVMYAYQRLKDDFDDDLSDFDEPRDMDIENVLDELEHVFLQEYSLTGHDICNDGFVKMIKGLPISDQERRYLREHMLEVWLPRFGEIVEQSEHVPDDFLHSGMGFILVRLFLGIVSMNVQTVPILNWLAHKFKTEPLYRECFATYHSLTQDMIAQLSVREDLVSYIVHFI